MSKVKELTKKEFIEKIFDYERESNLNYGGDPVIIDFYADWCGPCKNFAPIFDQASEENEEITFYKVNIENEPDLASIFGVRSIPTTVYLRKGKEPAQKTGLLSQEKLAEAIKEAFS